MKPSDAQIEAMGERYNQFRSDNDCPCSVCIAEWAATVAIEAAAKGAREEREQNATFLERLARECGPAAFLALSEAAGAIRTRGTP